MLKVGSLIADRNLNLLPKLTLNVTIYKDFNYSHPYVIIIQLVLLVAVIVNVCELVRDVFMYVFSTVLPLRECLAAPHKVKRSSYLKQNKTIWRKKKNKPKKEVKKRPKVSFVILRSKCQWKVFTRRCRSVCVFTFPGAFFICWSCCSCICKNKQNLLKDCGFFKIFYSIRQKIIKRKNNIKRKVPNHEQWCHKKVRTFILQ